MEGLGRSFPESGTLALMPLSLSHGVIIIIKLIDQSLIFQPPAWHCDVFMPCKFLLANGIYSHTTLS